MSDPIEIRPYLPQSLATIGQMAPAINAAAARYGVDPRAIAGAIALEQNNAQQFPLRYTIGNLASVTMLDQRDENGQHRLSSACAACARGLLREKHSQGFRQQNAKPGTFVPRCWETASGLIAS
jgi:hypothetical protein